MIKIIIIIIIIVIIIIIIMFTNIIITTLIIITRGQAKTRMSGRSLEGCSLLIVSTHMQNNN